MNQETKQTNENNHTYYVHYKIGDSEMSVGGPTQEFVNQHASVFLGVVSDEPKQMRLPVVIENSDSIPLVHNNSTQLIPERNDAIEKNSVGGASLLDLYLQLDPETQRERVMLIAYYYQQINEYEHISQDDYRSGFAELADVPVYMPSNLTVCLTRAVDAGLIRCIENNSYSLTRLTIKGIKEVESWFNKTES